MKITVSELKKIILEESLKLVEGMSSSKLNDSLQDLNQFIDIYEKKLESATKAEEDARAKEEFVELKTAKEEQVKAVEKLILTYNKKVDFLQKLKEESKAELERLSSQGVGAFSDKELVEFKNDDFKKGDKFKIETASKFITVEKNAELNSYALISTDVEGLKQGDYLKISDLKVGHQGTITIYRNVGGRTTEAGNMTLKMVKRIVKNPS